MKIYKRALIIILILGFSAGLIYSPQALARNYYSVGTASTGGTWYIVGAGFANQVNKRVKNVKLTAEITAGCLENWNLIKRGKMDIAMTNPDLVYDAAAKGREGGLTAKQANQLLWSYQLSQLEWYMRKGTPIKNIMDFKGKKIVAGPPGTTTLTNNLQVIEAITGYKPDKDYKAYYYNFAESKTAIQDGTVDVGLNGGGWPSGLMIDLSSTVDLDWVSLTEEQMQKGLKAYPALIKEIIPKGTYKGLNKDVLTLGWSSGFICRPELPTEDVYQMIKAWFTDVAKRNVFHPKVKTYSVEATLDFGATIAKAGIPFHPGVKKYLQEIGKWSQALEVKK